MRTDNTSETRNSVENLSTYGKSRFGIWKLIIHVRAAKYECIKTYGSGFFSFFFFFFPEPITPGKGIVGEIQLDEVDGEDEPFESFDEDMLTVRALSSIGVRTFSI